MGFKNLKAKLKDSTSSLDKIKSRIEKETSTTDYNDERYWKFTVDSSGNGMAVIRFLPEPEGEEFPYVSYYNHSFQGPTGKWYINRSRTSLGKGVPDPVSESNSELWETGLEENKNLARKRKRNLRYISNIYVIKDAKNPENEGKVMLWEYGPSIYKVIADVIAPPEEFEEEPINPFDLWNGADFKLKAYLDSKSGYRSYDKSSFTDSVPLLDGDDEKLEKVYDSMHSLAAEVAEDKYKSYDELKKWFDVVTGKTKLAAPGSNDNGEDDDVEVPATRNAIDDDEDEDDVSTASSSSDDDDDYLNFLED